MLKFANIDVVNTLRVFKGRKMRIGFLVPTETGLKKSIMDATQDLRKLLKSTKAHDFSSQPQGTAHKKILPTYFVSRGEVIDTKTSLYRPETKKGDPRIWISELGKYADPGDLLAIGYDGDRLVAINCSTTRLTEFLDSANSIAAGLRPEETYDSPFETLVDRLKHIGRQGFIQTMRPGDTGVGYTLESRLGIQANSSKLPDFKGIELKAGRARTHKSGQVTIFSQVPNWKISRLKRSKDILTERGRYSEDKQRQQLFHEISAKAPNSYGLQLDLREKDGLLTQVYVENNTKPIIDVIWEIDTLKKRFAQKHKETVWITAEAKGKGADEEFWYQTAKHTKGIDEAAFPILLDSGAITVHYLIKQLPNGAAKDQGYLFKTSPSNLDLLFETSEEVDLAH